MYQYHTLNNGLKIVLSQNQSRVLYSGVYINVGSRDESEHDEGMAHFIEHCMFKGTTHRRAHHILDRIDGVGGELSAFTTKEETCLYATALVEHLERCIELFADILFCSTFPSAELEKEKDVVVEEINSYNDIPAERICDQFEELVFEGHPLAHNILGTKRHVRHFTSDRLSTFMRSHYTPSRMVLSVVGNVKIEQLVRLAERYFGGVEGGTSMEKRSVAPVFHPFERHINRHAHQTHIMLGCEAPSVYNPDKTAFALINNIIGGPAMNSWLNVAVREHYGFCYTIESQYEPYSDSGLFNIYAGVDHHAEDKALRLIRNELNRMADAKMSERQLQRACSQYSAQMAIAQADGGNEMQSIGKAYLGFDHVETIEEIHKELMSLTPEEIQRVAQRYFAADRMALLVYN